MQALTNNLAKPKQKTIFHTGYRDEMSMQLIIDSLLARGVQNVYC